MDLETILEKYFKDKKVLFYNPSDAIDENNYIRWEYFRGERSKILISLGSDDGEIKVKIFTKLEDLEEFIRMVIY